MNSSSLNFYQVSTRVFCLLSFFLVFSCQTESDYEEGKTAYGEHAMVVTAHPEASKVGIEVLKNGGNAIDAMVAVHFALAVVYPSAGNVGGGGFLVYRENSGSYHTLDFREKAPGVAYEEMYVNEDGEIRLGESIAGPKASGVPGSVDGMLTAHAKFGTILLADLLEPAVKLAEDGFKITAKQARNYNIHKTEFIENNRDSTRVALIKDPDWQEGDRLIQKDLAATIRRIQANGRAGFYTGETADLIVAEMEAGAGLISHDDLESYNSVWRNPIVGNFKGYKIVGMAPPSSGGVALMQLLTMAESFNLKELGHNTTETIHLMTEMQRRVYADRAEHLGDSDFWEVPVQALLDKEYLNSRVQSIERDSKTSSDSIKAMDHAYAESEETTHYSILDPYGNAVAVTTTINSGYGSKTFVQGAGFLLNNEMDDFSMKPGVPNVYGLLGGAANAIQPNKRMLSAMTPTLVEKDGKLLMIVGTPGGSTIITTVFQVVLNVLEHDMTMTEAIEAKRIHHQWYPDVVYLEPDALDQTTQTRLEELGHQFRSRSPIGRVDAILVSADGRLEGAADPRGDDWAAGY